MSEGSLIPSGRLKSLVSPQARVILKTQVWPCHRSASDLPVASARVETGILHVGSMPATLAFLSIPHRRPVLFGYGAFPDAVLSLGNSLPRPHSTPIYPALSALLLCGHPPRLSFCWAPRLALPPSSSHLPGLQRALAVLTNRFPQYPLQILPPQILTIQTQVLNTLRSCFLEIGLVSVIIPYYSLSQTQEQKRVDSPASLVIQSLCQPLESFRLGEWGRYLPTDASWCISRLSQLQSGTSLWACSVFLILVIIPARYPVLGIHWIINHLKGESLPLDLIKVFIAMHKSNPLLDSKLLGLIRGLSLGEIMKTARKSLYRGYVIFQSFCLDLQEP